MRQDREKLNAVTKKKVLALEGNDECVFFEALLDYMGITECQIYDIGGKDKFKFKIPALVKTSELDFDLVEVFAMIRDADDKPEGAFESIRNIAKKAGLNPSATVNTFGNSKPKVGIFIMPGNSETGMLEDLCLETVKDLPVMAHVNNYINCVEQTQGKKLKKVAKAKAQVYLASTPDIICGVGLGAKRKYWDFTSSALDDLKTFLENMR